MRQLISISLACVLALAATIACSANTISVPQNYPTIQAAVDHAYPGDKIRVGGGTYHESVTVINTYNIEISGESGATIIGTGDPFQWGINFFSGGNSVHGMTIKNCGVGINTFFAASIHDNTVTACGVGILAGVAGDGISLPAPTSIDHNLVYRNNIGIDLSGCQNVTASHNTVLNNGIGFPGIDGGSGIRVEFSDHCFVTGNLAFTNQIGIIVFGSGNNSITYNIALGNVEFDAVDVFDNPALGPNVWAHNFFGITSGI